MIKPIPFFMAFAVTFAISNLAGIPALNTKPNQANTPTAKLQILENELIFTGAFKIAAGGNHACAITQEGGVRCWGNNNDGQLGDGTHEPHNMPVDVVGLSSGVTAIAAGAQHTCAIQSGAAKCWGWNANGSLGEGTTTSSSIPVDVGGLERDVVAITAGDTHTCALLVTGGVKCWGGNNEGQLGDGTNVSSTLPVDVFGLSSGAASISAGPYTTCAVVDGGARCWGWNNTGQLGDGTTSSSAVPVDVAGLPAGVTQVAEGNLHTCALVSGSVKCWGDNAFQELGDGTANSSLSPVDVIDLPAGITAISSGFSFTCALSSLGGVKCWGYGLIGQLGSGASPTSSPPVDVVGLANGVTSISTGNSFACALVDGGVKCWGSNSMLQLGDGTQLYRPIPMDTQEVSDGVQELSAGVETNCLVTGEGGVKCWGNNGYGWIGNDPSVLRINLPTAIAGLENGVTSVAANTSHACAVVNGGVKRWGSNDYGELGNGTTTSSRTPVDVIGLSEEVISIRVGLTHSCALTSLGGVKCWGFNNVGQLGNGSSQASSTPVDVVDLTSGVLSIAAGAQHTCALTSEGAALCWGWNISAQLGDGTKIDRNEPVPVVGLSSGVTAIAGGTEHTCAVANGGVKCWGSNYYGELGNGTTSANLQPVDVVGLSSGASAVAAGQFHSCAIADGAVKCWGYNLLGMLGDGSSTDSLTPVSVSGLEDNTARITAGFNHTCALTQNGRVKCWGSDTSAQMGIGTNTISLVPVNVVVSASTQIGYPDGEPGSIFTLTGYNFLPNSVLNVRINKYSLGTVSADAKGNFILFLDSALANDGEYRVEVNAISAGPSPANLSQTAAVGQNKPSSGFIYATPLMFSLDTNARLRVQEGGGTILKVPAGLGNFIFNQFLATIIH